jgi:hypothetical protein
LEEGGGSYRILRGKEDPSKQRGHAYVGIQNSEIHQMLFERQRKEEDVEI